MKGLPVSLAELIAAGTRPLPGEAVAILLDVCRQVTNQPADGSVRPAITPSGVYVDGSGRVAMPAGIPVEDDQTVQLLGRLLLQLLPPPDGAPAFRVPPRLRDLAVRAAAGELRRLPVGRLAASLRRFAPEPPHVAVRALFERWSGGEAEAARADAWREARAAAGSSLLPGAEPTGFRARLPLRRTVGALAGTLLILASVGAAYWLNADLKLPPIPLSPMILSEPPAPPRDGWELLDPAGLAVQVRPADAWLDPAAGQKTAARISPAEPGPVHRPEQ